MAKLKAHHILALRLYTTSSYSQINNPLRQDPPQRPHPFAATTGLLDNGNKALAGEKFLEQKALTEG
jgi:hypothetical protein